MLSHPNTQIPPRNSCWPWRERWRRSRGCRGSPSAPTLRTWRCPGKGRRASPRRRPCWVRGAPPPACWWPDSPPAPHCSPSPRTESADSSWWRSSRSSCKPIWTNWPGPCKLSASTFYIGIEDLPFPCLENIERRRESRKQRRAWSLSSPT